VATRVTRVANSDKKAKPFNAILPTSEPTWIQIRTLGPLMALALAGSSL